MTDLEIQEQAEKMYPVKLIVIDASLSVDSNKLSREAFIQGAKWTQEQAKYKYPQFRDNNSNDRVLIGGFIECTQWMQEQDEWIPLPSKELLPSGYYAIRISHNGFVDVKFEFIDNQIIPYHYATHYYPIHLPSPPKNK